MGRIRYDDGTPAFVAIAIENAYTHGTVRKVSAREMISPEYFAHYPAEFFDHVERDLRRKFDESLAKAGLQVLISSGVVWQTALGPGRSELARKTFRPEVWSRQGDPKGASLPMGRTYMEVVIRAVAVPEIIVPIGEW